MDCTARNFWNDPGSTGRDVHVHGYVHVDVNDWEDLTITRRRSPPRPERRPSVYAGPRRRDGSCPKLVHRGRKGPGVQARMVGRLARGSCPKLVHRGRKGPGVQARMVGRLFRGSFPKLVHPRPEGAGAGSDDEDPDPQFFGSDAGTTGLDVHVYVDVNVNVNDWEHLPFTQ